MSHSKESRVEVAILPRSIANSPVSVTIYGKLIQNRIIAFVAKSSPDFTLSAQFSPPNKVSVEGQSVNPYIVIIPDLRPGHRIIPTIPDNGELGDSATKDEFREALELYGKLQQKDDDQCTTLLEAPRTFVPPELVQLCKASSLMSSETSSSNKISWDQLSMTVAVRRRRFSSKSALWFDIILGLILFFLLATFWQMLYDFVSKRVSFEGHTLKERVEFVMAKHAPLGFKLNPQADFVLGNLVILVVDAWANLMYYPEKYTKEIFIGSCVSAFIINKGNGGLSILFAVTFDLFAVVGTHVGVLHRVISRILRFQLRLIGSFALLMRGKKRNVLRSRVDTLRTDSAQLMLGTMGIFFFFFTLQTTLAYHILVLAIWSLIFILQTVLFFICVLLRSLPSKELRTAYSDKKYARDHGAKCPKSIYLNNTEQPGVFEVVIIPVSSADVVVDWLKKAFNLWTLAWAKRWGTQKVLLNVLFGNELPSVPPPAF